jgi:outer membrane protein OmpA-like peptidoglycan-associated protein/tetratricopeptide (TPR) repeat protein
MKKILLLAAIISIPVLVFSQGYRTRTANKYFDNYQYARAAQLYEQQVEVDTANKLEILEKLYQCYKKMNNTVKAEKWLAQLIERGGDKPEYHKDYSVLVASNGKYSDAKKYLEFYTSKNEDKDAKNRLEAYSNLDIFYQDSTLYNVEAVSFNSRQADFSPAFYNNTIIFASSRGTRTRFTKIYKWDNSLYLDLYVKSENSESVTAFSEKLNSKMHEGPVTFTAGYDTIYFTRNTYTSMAGRDGVNRLKIFKSVKKNGEWSVPSAFELNSADYSVAHPALLGSTVMYFASDMPGGAGGTDIYVTYLKDGKWSAPENLGSSVNSAGNEQFPYVDENGVLFFASNGLPGLGGLDVFSAEKTENGFRVRNLGYPVNSSKDDFGMIIKKRKGYFSSNRGENPADDNIYSFEVTTIKEIFLVAVNKKDQRKLDSVMLSGGTDMSSGESNFIRLTLDYEKPLNATINRKKYKSGDLAIQQEEFRKLRSGDTLFVELEKLAIPKKINFKIVDKKGKAINNSALKLTATDSLIQTASQNISYTFNPEQVYDLRISAKEFMIFPFKITEAMLDTIPDGYNWVVSLEKSGIFNTNEIGTLIELHIRYDKGKAIIRPDAAKELDKLVDYMNQYPAVKIELGSHTDIHGTAEANHILSQKRADSALGYLIKKGIDKDRIVSIGFGEEVLKIVDAKNEKEHEMNRRTTAKIIGN